MTSLSTSISRKTLISRKNFLKVTCNHKHKVNKEIQHLFDIELSIKNCLDDLFNNIGLSNEVYKF